MTKSKTGGNDGGEEVKRKERKREIVKEEIEDKKKEWNYMERENCVAQSNKAGKERR